jgi:serine O-acetyltransferase
VTVYSNSTLIGKIRIGRGATICGNVWIAEDVPAGSTVTQLKIEN